MLPGKTHLQIKLYRLQKSATIAIDSLQEVLKLKQNFQKYKLVTGKTPVFVIGLFCSHYSICLNIVF